MSDTWITKSSRESLKKAIKARLRVGDAHANRIIENAWLVYTKEALINTPEGTLAYVRDYIGARVRICLETTDGDTTIATIMGGESLARAA